MTFLGGGASGGSIDIQGVVSNGNPNEFVDWGTNVAFTANDAFGYRMTIPKSGVLRDLAIFPAVASGNIDIGVFQLAGSNRTLLYHSGSIACPAISAWRIVGNPGLQVVAGQQYDIALACDNITARFAGPQTGGFANAAGVLPASYILDPTGALGIIAWRIPALFPLANTTEAAMVNIPGGAMAAIIGRIASN